MKLIRSKKRLMKQTRSKTRLTSLLSRKWPSRHRRKLKKLKTKWKLKRILKLRLSYKLRLRMIMRQLSKLQLKQPFSRKELNVMQKSQD